MAAPIDFVATSRALAERLQDYRPRVDTTIAPGDEMFTGDLEDYMSVSHSAIAQIAHTMTICGRTSLTVSSTYPAATAESLAASGRLSRMQN